MVFARDLSSLGPSVHLSNYRIEETSKRLGSPEILELPLVIDRIVSTTLPPAKFVCCSPHLQMSLYLEVGSLSE